MPTAPKTHRAHDVAATRRQYDRRAGFRGRRRQDAKRRIYLLDECCCRACKRLVLLSESHLDHIVPLCRGGSNDDENLQTLCIACSNLKTAGEQG